MSDSITTTATLYEYNNAIGALTKASASPVVKTSLRLDEKVPKSKYATLIERIVYLFFTALSIILLFEYILLLISVSDLTTYRPAGIALIFECFGARRVLSASTVIFIIIAAVTTILSTYFSLRENPHFFSIGHRKMIFIRNKILILLIFSIIILLMYLNALH